MALLEIRNLDHQRISIHTSFVSNETTQLNESTSLDDLRYVIVTDVECDDANSESDVALLVFHRARDRFICNSSVSIDDRIDESIDRLILSYNNIRSSERGATHLIINVTTAKPTSVSIYVNDCLKLMNDHRSRTIKHNASANTIASVNSCKRSAVTIRLRVMSMLMLEAMNAARELHLSVNAIIPYPTTPSLVDQLNKLDGSYLFRSFFDDESHLCAVLGEEPTDDKHRSNVKLSASDHCEAYDITGFDRIQRFISLPRPTLDENLSSRIERECIDYLVGVK